MAKHIFTGNVNLGGADIAEAELELLDSVIAGAGAASKAMTLDASGNFLMPANGQFEYSNATPAAAGADATDATVLAAQINLVTGADGAKGVALPAAADNLAIYVLNTSLTANLLVYPVNGGNDQINALAEDAAFTMGPGKGAWFTATSATQWYVPDSAGVLATTTEANLVDGSTAGSVVNSKAAVYSAAGFLARSSATPAGAGNSQGTATALTAEFNAVTGADGTVGVALPTAAENIVCLVLNTSNASTLKVYPASGGTINALAQDAAFSLGAGQLGVFIGRSATQWYVALQGNVALINGLLDLSAGASDIKIPDNNATALRIREGTADYIIFVTSDNSESVAVQKRLTTTDGVASGTAKVVGGMAFSDVAAADTVTAAASNNSFVAFAQTYTIPADTLKAGSVLRAKALVVVNDASGTDTLTVEMRVGGQTIVATTAVDPGATTDLHLLELEFVARAAPGAAASCVGVGAWMTNTGGTIANGSGLLAPTNFATNGALVVDVRAKWSSNTASTSARLELLNVDIY